MIQETYQRALKFAGEKHHNQKVPGTNANYLLHISNVAMEILMANGQESNFDLVLAIKIAILHDTIEDTNTTYDEVKFIFGERVADGVLALTKNDSLSTKQEKMMDSLTRINQLEKEVGMVKLADRITNLQEPPKHWGKEKIRNYLEESKMIAMHLADKNDYLNQRIIDKIKTYTQYC